MAKRLTMAEIDTILTLRKAGHSSREIAALVGVNRETVGKHLARIKAQNQPNAPTGKPLDDPGGCPAGNDADDDPTGVVSQNPSDHPAGGARSSAEPSSVSPGNRKHTRRTNRVGSIPAKRAHRETRQSSRSDTSQTRPPAPGGDETHKILVIDPCQHTGSRR
jgi:hypothetical protein